MRDFNPRPEVRPEAFQFAGATNGGSFVRSRPRSPFSNAEEMELALELLQVTSEADARDSSLAIFSRKHGGASSRSGRKSLGLSGGSSRQSLRRRCLP